MNSYWNFFEINILIITIALLIIVFGKKLKFIHQRLLLIGIPLMALMAVWLKSFVPKRAFSLELSSIDLAPVFVGNDMSTNQYSFDFSWEMIYVIGLGLFLILSVIRLLRTMKVFRDHDCEQVDQFRIYCIPNRPSFSFFNSIQLSPELEGKSAEMVLDHEKLHALKNHSLDLVIMEIIHAFFWLKR